MTTQQTQFDPQTPITLRLNLSMVQGILVALGKLPYDQAVGLIENLRQQAEAQLQRPPVPTEIPEATQPTGE